MSILKLRRLGQSICYANGSQVCRPVFFGVHCQYFASQSQLRCPPFLAVLGFALLLRGGRRLTLFFDTTKKEHHMVFLFVEIAETGFEPATSGL